MSRHRPPRRRRWGRWLREVGFWLLVLVSLAWLAFVVWVEVAVGCPSLAGRCS